MGGFQDGYNRIMHPGDGDYGAWRLGGAQRTQDDIWAGVTARHNAAMEQWGRAPANQQSGYVGGSVELSDEDVRTLWGVAIAIAALVFAAWAWNAATAWWNGERRVEAAPVTELQPLTEPSLPYVAPVRADPPPQNPPAEAAAPPQAVDSGDGAGVTGGEEPDVGTAPDAPDRIEPQATQQVASASGPAKDEIEGDPDLAEDMSSQGAEKELKWDRAH